MVSPLRLPLLAGAVLVSLTTTHAARATGALLPPSDSAVAPSTLDVETAIATAPAGTTTRWTRLHVGGPLRAMWLVPARPGAAIDWAGDAWLDALDQATAVRVAPPEGAPACVVPTRAERIGRFGSAPPKGPTPTTIAVHTTAADASAHAAAEGFAISSAVASKIAQVYANGGALVSIVLDLPSGYPATTPTLRVSDDGGATLPFALTGSAAVSTRIDAYVVSTSPVTVAGATTLGPADVTWGALGSDYGARRVATLAGGGFLRESSTHEALFSGVDVPRGDATPALVDLYFADPSCASAAKTAASGTSSAGRVCAPGTAATVPGGTTCAASPDAVDLTCGTQLDLALALSGAPPKSAYVTRFSSLVPNAALGSDVAIASGAAAKSPVLVAGAFDDCPVVVPPGSRPSTDDPGSSSSGSAPSAPGGSGGTVTVVTNTPDNGSSNVVVVTDGCGGSTDSSDDGSDSSSDSCDSSSSSSSDESSSSSSDSCGSSSSSSSSSSSDNGEDTTDETKDSSKDSCGSSDAAPKKNASHRRKSPVSRVALLLVLLLLPLRRRLR